MAVVTTRELDRKLTAIDMLRRGVSMDRITHVIGATERTVLDWAAILLGWRFCSRCAIRLDVAGEGPGGICLWCWQEAQSQHYHEPLYTQDPIVGVIGEIRGMKGGVRL